MEMKMMNSKYHEWYGNYKKKKTPGWFGLQYYSHTIGLKNIMPKN